MASKQHPTSGTPTKVADPLLTVAEVARRLGMSAKSVRHRISTGELPALRLGVTHASPVRVRQPDLDAYLADCEQRARTFVPPGNLAAARDASAPGAFEDHAGEQDDRDNGDPLGDDRPGGSRSAADKPAR